MTDQPMGEKGIRFACFGSRFASSAVTQEMPWADWVSVLKAGAKASIKKDMPCLVLAHMSDGSSRTNAEVQAISGLALDIERKATSLTPLAFKERWALVKRHVLPLFACYAHTTWSHTPEEPRYRIIMPLAEPVDPSLYKPLMRFLTGLCGHIADGAAQKLSQPSIFPVHKEHFEEFVFEGPLLNPNAPYIRQALLIRKALGEGRGTTPTGILKEVCTNILLGKSFAEEGERDDMAARIAMKIGSYARDIDDVSAVEAVFGWSLSQMGADAPSADNILDKIQRAAGKASNDDADLIGEPVDKPIPGAPKHRIIQCQGHYWFQDVDGNYSWPCSKEDAPLGAKKFLSGHSDMKLYKKTSNGIVPTPISELAHRYATLAKDVVFDLCAHENYFDEKTNTFTQAILDRPVTEPVYNKGIEQWLFFLGGRQHETLLDWCALCPDLNRPLAALVLIGAPGAGKNLLASGLGRIFSTNALSKQSDLTGQFHAGLLKNPLVLIDEEIQEQRYGRSFMGSIRSDISQETRTVNIKYRSELELRGHTRYIINANHIPFSSDNATSKDDADAIMERFLWIDTPHLAAAYLKKIPQETRKRWATHEIAQHVLWLQQNRVVTTDARFGVKGSPELADRILLGSRWNHWVVEWLVKGISNKFERVYQATPKTDRHPLTHGVFIKSGTIYIRLQTIQHFWKTYLPDDHKSFADTRPLAQALQSVTDDIVKAENIGFPGIDKRYRYHAIRRSALIEWVRMSGHDDINWVSDVLSPATEKARLVCAA